MLENIKVFTSDKYWNHILSDLGMYVVDNPLIADVIFDDINVNMPISVDVLQDIILSKFNNNDIILTVFGHDVVLPELQRKIIVALYKNPDININDLKRMVGFMPDITTHSVENAIYQLRKTYGHDFIINENGGYKIGRL